eukprot:10467074-Ditylum_brightwellii.AAC.1
MLILLPQDVIERGLVYKKIDHQCNQKEESKQLKFQQYYGSSTLFIACMWYDIQTTHLPAPDHEDCPTKVKDWVEIEENEKPEGGSKLFM